MDMDSISRAFFSPDRPAGSSTIRRPGFSGFEDLSLSTRGILGAGFREGQPPNREDAGADDIPGPLRGTCLDGNDCFIGELYHEFGPSAHGGFVVAKPLRDCAAMLVFIEPMGRGPRAALTGAYLKGAVAGFLSSGAPDLAAKAPGSCLARLDGMLESALNELAIPGAMATMSAVIVSAGDDRVTLLCRGTGGVAVVRSDGAPAWMDGGGAPPFGVLPPGLMPPGFGLQDLMPGTAAPKPRTYTFAPGDTLVLANGQFDDVPGLDPIVAKGFVPVLAARAKSGGRFSAGGATLVIPPPEAESFAVPERMAVALHALRLAGLKRNANEPRGTLILEPDQAAFFERICRASGLELPASETVSKSCTSYIDAAPLDAKPLLAFSLRRI